MKPNHWLLSYDVRRARARRKLMKWAMDRGHRLQRSLYAVTLDFDHVVGAEAMANSLLDPHTDKLMLRPVCRACLAGSTEQGRSADIAAREPFWIV